MSIERRKLVRESEWARVYELKEPEGVLFESKFLVDDLRVSPSAVRERWAHLSEVDRVEFASAFAAQPPRDAQDQAILEFLMEVGPEEVWRSIATVSAFHPNSDHALQFLLERVQRAVGPRADYYQGLELLRRSEAVPLLRAQYGEYERLLSGKPPRLDDLGLWTDFLQCSKTLLTLTQDPVFLAALKQAEATAPQQLRSLVAHLLHDHQKT